MENTLLHDISTLEQAEKIVADLFDKLVFRLQRNWGDTPLTEFKKLGIKLKFDDFSQTTLERTTDGFAYERFGELLQQILPEERNERCD